MSGAGASLTLRGLRPPAAGKSLPACRLHRGSGTPGIERLDAAFAGPAFAPHRHDTYAIGMTLRGVQTFRYRGAQRYCMAGEGHVLHPDEMHDGAAGTAEGFHYRILYIDPALVQDALGGQPLPFVPDPVIGRGHMQRLFALGLSDIYQELDELGSLDLMLEVVRLLRRHAGIPPAAPAALALPALARVRDLIAADPSLRRAAAELERVAGLDRWTLARQFRSAFGTSPSHFRTMRQLDKVRALLRGGMELAAAATEAGFADQSHMSRMFKRAYGLAPAQWRNAQA